MYPQRDGEGGGSAVRCGTERIRQVSPCRASGLGERGRTRGAGGAAAEMPWGGGGMRAQSWPGSDGLSGGLQPKAELGLDENSLLLTFVRGKNVTIPSEEKQATGRKDCGFLQKD